MSTPLFAPHPDALASYAARAGAALTDALIVAVVATIVISAAVGGSVDEDTSPVAVAGVYLALAGLVYAPGLMSRKGERNGQTLGKQWLGVRVVRADGAPVTFGSALVREGIGKSALAFVPFFSLVDNLFPLSDAHRQSLHDKIGKTYVVGAVHQHEFEDHDDPAGFVPAPAVEPPGKGWAPPAERPTPPQGTPPRGGAPLPGASPLPGAPAQDERFGPEGFAPPVAAPPVAKDPPADP